MAEPATGIPGACIPRHAVGEWLALARVLADHGPAPCEEGDPEVWWLDKKDMDAPSTRMAVRACSQCPARDACLDYALAADERFGVWGGLLPEARRELRTDAA
jgi:hypothetical protein